MAAYNLVDNTTSIRQEGVWINEGSDAGVSAKRTSAAASALHFVATPSDGTIAIHTFGLGQKIALYKYTAGAWLLVGRTTAANDSAWVDLTLGTGIVNSEGRFLIAFGPVATYVTKLIVGSLNGATLAVRDTFASYGDSTVQGTSGTTGDATLSDGFLLALAHDLAYVDAGFDGTLVKKFGSPGNASYDNAGEVRYAAITSISPAPAKVLDRYCLNDSGQLNGAETPSDLQAAKITELTALTAGLPTTMFYVENVIKTSSGYPATTTWDAAVAAAVSAVNTSNSNSNCVLVNLRDLDATYDSTSGNDTADGTHPNTSGYAKLTTFEDPLIFGGPDTTPPTLPTVTVGANGLTTTNAYDETVGGLDAAEYSLNSAASPVSLSSPTGSGDDSTWTWTNSRAVFKAETPTLDYEGTGTVDASGNPLAAISGKAVVNNSTVICAVPIGLSVTGYNGKLRIRWTADTEPVLKDYKVYTSATLGGTYTLATGGTVLAGTNTLLLTSANDTQVFVKITSRDTADNESAKSAAVSATPTAAAGEEPAGNPAALFASFGSGFGF
jgi:lysophospholipase L1-like esterase